MPDPTASTSIAHAIQLAVAPVFLLTGIGAILAVLTNRLGRIIDRARVLHPQLHSAPASAATALDPVRAELKILARRGRLIHWAIMLCTGSALLICSVVAVIFLAEFTSANLRLVIASLFVAAMGGLFLAVLSFLREIFLAIAHLRLNP